MSPMPFFTPAPNRENNKAVFVYGLSTCVRTQAVKAFLAAAGETFGHVDLDLLPPGGQKGALAEMGAYNPARTFPTTVIGLITVVGDDGADLTTALAKLAKRRARDGQ